MATDSPSPEPGPLPGKALFVLANRAPVKVDATGVVHPAAGGFSSPMLKLSRLANGVCIGIAMGAEEVQLADRLPADAAATVAIADGESARLFFLRPNPDDYRAYYSGAANGWLWPIQHRDATLFGPNPPAFDNTAYDAFSAYMKIQSLFADSAVALAKKDGRPPVFMLQDYHLYGVAVKIRKQLPGAVIQQFVHIPWPSADYWNALPKIIRREVIGGLLGNDIVGFHTTRDAENFRQTCAANGCYVSGTSVRRNGMTTQVEVYGIGPDLAREERIARSPDLPTELAYFQRELSASYMPEGRCKMIFAASRVEPSKNVPASLAAFERMLELHPEQIGRVVFWQFLQVSRQDVEAYRQHYEDIMAEALRINERFGNESWTPIRLDGHDKDALPHIHAGFRSADVLAMVSRWDGMNLTVMEGVLSALRADQPRNPAVVASERMGAHELLGDHMVSVDPDSVDEMADAFHLALTQPLSVRRPNLLAMKDLIETNDCEKWMRDQVADVARLLTARETSGVSLAL